MAFLLNLGKAGLNAGVNVANASVNVVGDVAGGGLDLIGQAANKAIDHTTAALGVENEEVDRQQLDSIIRELNHAQHWLSAIIKLRAEFELDPNVLGIVSTHPRMLKMLGKTLFRLVRLGESIDDLFLEENPWAVTAQDRFSDQYQGEAERQKYLTIMLHLITQIVNSIVVERMEDRTYLLHVLVEECAQSLLKIQHLYLLRTVCNASPKCLELIAGDYFVRDGDYLSRLLRACDMGMISTASHGMDISSRKKECVTAIGVLKMFLDKSKNLCGGAVIEGAIDVLLRAIPETYDGQKFLLDQEEASLLVLQTIELLVSEGREVSRRYIRSSPETPALLVHKFGALLSVTSADDQIFSNVLSIVELFHRDCKEKKTLDDGFAKLDEVRRFTLQFVPTLSKKIVFFNTDEGLRMRAIRLVIHIVCGSVDSKLGSTNVTSGSKSTDDASPMVDDEDETDFQREKNAQAALTTVKQKQERNEEREFFYGFLIGTAANRKVCSYNWWVHLLVQPKTPRDVRDMLLHQLVIRIMLPADFLIESFTGSVIMEANTQVSPCGLQALNLAKEIERCDLEQWYNLAEQFNYVSEFVVFAMRTIGMDVADSLDQTATIAGTTHIRGNIFDQNMEALTGEADTSKGDKNAVNKKRKQIAALLLQSRSSLIGKFASVLRWSKLLHGNMVEEAHSSGSKGTNGSDDANARSANAVIPQSLPSIASSSTGIQTRRFGAAISPEAVSAETTSVGTGGEVQIAPTAHSIAPMIVTQRCIDCVLRLLLLCCHFSSEVAMEVANSPIHLPAIIRIINKSEASESLRAVSSVVLGLLVSQIDTLSKAKLPPKGVNGRQLMEMITNKVGLEDFNEFIRVPLKIHNAGVAVPTLVENIGRAMVSVFLDHDEGSVSTTVKKAADTAANGPSMELLRMQEKELTRVVEENRELKQDLEKLRAAQIDQDKVVLSLEIEAMKRQTRNLQMQCDLHVLGYMKMEKELLLRTQEHRERENELKSHLRMLCADLEKTRRELLEAQFAKDDPDFKERKPEDLLNTRLVSTPSSLSTSVATIAQHGDNALMNPDGTMKSPEQGGESLEQANILAQAYQDRNAELEAKLKDVETRVDQQNGLFRLLHQEVPEVRKYLAPVDEEALAVAEKVAEARKIPFSGIGIGGALSGSPSGRNKSSAYVKEVSEREEFMISNFLKSMFDSTKSVRVGQLKGGLQSGSRLQSGAMQYGDNSRGLQPMGGGASSRSRSPSNPASSKHASKNAEEVSAVIGLTINAGGGTLGKATRNNAGTASARKASRKSADSKDSRNEVSPLNSKAATTAPTAKAGSSSPSAKAEATRGTPVEKDAAAFSDVLLKAANIDFRETDKRANAPSRPSEESSAEHAESTVQVSVSGQLLHPSQASPQVGGGLQKSQLPTGQPSNIRVLTQPLFTGQTKPLTGTSTAKTEYFALSTNLTPPGSTTSATNELENMYSRMDLYDSNESQSQSAFKGTVTSETAATGTAATAAHGAAGTSNSATAVTSAAGAHAAHEAFESSAASSIGHTSFSTAASGAVTSVATANVTSAAATPATGEAAGSYGTSMSSTATVSALPKPTSKPTTVSALPKPSASATPTYAFAGNRIDYTGGFPQQVTSASSGSTYTAQTQAQRTQAQAVNRYSQAQQRQQHVNLRGQHEQANLQPHQQQSGLQQTMVQGGQQYHQESTRQYQAATAQQTQSAASTQKATTQQYANTQQAAAHQVAASQQTNAQARVVSNTTQAAVQVTTQATAQATTAQSDAAALAQSNAAHQPVLQPGWGQYSTPEGNVYYFNTLTGESRWDPPPGFSK